MLLIEQQAAFVLHSRPYRETSLLLECLTRDYGRLGVVARGVRRERARVSRSQLEPFQLLSLNLQLRGELASLLNVDLHGASNRLLGDAGVAGLYLNELVMRLTERQDPNAALFEAYAETLRRLAGGAALGWSLRRFERDLLQAIGYGLQLEHEADSGGPLDPTAWYRYEAEQGAVRAGAADKHTLRGADLLALGTDQPPDAEGLAALRRMMRELIRHHLGGGELRAWRVLPAALSRR